MKKLGSSSTLITYIWLITGLSITALSFFLDSIIVVAIVFLLLYVMMNVRKPIMVEVIG
ncbi:MAG: hypothetical protein WC219_05690 [Acholeplasmataceae bacterium]